MPNAGIRILLAELVDYAGLFPPAQLDMAGAVRAYAGYRDGAFSWMLGRFIARAAQLDEFEQAAAALLPAYAADEPWRLSILTSGSADDLERIDAFNARHSHPAEGLAVVDTIETKAGSVEAIEKLIQSSRGGTTMYIEIPVADDPADLIAAIGGRGARAKVRTGGVTGDVFPPPDELARFIRACVDAGVPFKATAGLHHPLRGAYRLTYADDSERGMMYGFLNVFLAAAFATHGLPLADIESLLQTSDPATLTIDDSGATWRGHRLDLDDLRHARLRAATTFGSCSFTEPVDDLHSLRLL
ncbi:MAG: hypothetical protein ABI637_02040 [Gemmatimonadota bacterium]